MYVDQMGGIRPSEVLWLDCFKASWDSWKCKKSHFSFKGPSSCGPNVGFWNWNYKACGYRVGPVLPFPLLGDIWRLSNSWLTVCVLINHSSKVAGSRWGMIFLSTDLSRRNGFLKLLVTVIQNIYTFGCLCCFGNKTKKKKSQDGT